MVVGEPCLYQPTAFPSFDQQGDDTALKSALLVSEQFAGCPGMELVGGTDDESDISEYELETINDELNHTIRLTRSDILGATMQSKFKITRTEIDEMISKILMEQISESREENITGSAIDAIQMTQADNLMDSQIDSSRDRSNNLEVIVPDQPNQDSFTIDIITILFCLTVAVPIMFIEALTKGPRFFFRFVKPLASSLFQ